MIFKEKLVHFLEQSSQKLKLTYQSTLQSIQIINVIDTLHRVHLNKILNKNWTKAKLFALALLRLCCKLFQVKHVHMREFVRIIEKRYQDFAVEDLTKQSRLNQKTGEAELSCDQIQTEIEQFQMRIALWLKWKLSMPLLYDEVIMIASAWDNFTLQLHQSSILFEVTTAGCCSQNHNNLVNSIRICLYNFNHLIKNTAVQNLSQRIHHIAISIFITAIKFIIKQKFTSSKQTLHSQVSLNLLLQEFLTKHYQLQISNLQEEVNMVLEVLNSYRIFKQKSKAKRHPEFKEDYKKKLNKQSKKHSQDHENIMYYVNRARSRSKLHFKQNEGRRQGQSRSKSRKDKTKDSKQNSRLNKNRHVHNKMPTYKNKSNSTKSITSKSISLVKRQKSSDETESKKLKKKVRCNISNVTKNIDKVPIPAKMTAPAHQNYVTVKSTYWQQLNAHTKTDKKSNNSSIRMKIR